MNLRQQKRLLNVAKALREGKKENFNMCWWGYTADDEPYGKTCGTPACALGHYAARTDLQKFMKLGVNNDLKYRKSGRKIPDGFRAAQKHFGISQDESSLLFDSDGCGNAHTNKQAARYIERFVARESKEAKR